MSAQNDLTHSLRFSCPACHAELAVPVAMAGIEGPCPSCYQTIRAPLRTPVFIPPPEPVPAPPAWGASEEPILPVAAPRLRPAAREDWTEAAAPVFPPARAEEVKPLPPPSRGDQPVLQPGFPLVPRGGDFKARLAIPPPEEPLDDSWKERHRDQRRSGRRTRRVEKAAHQFLESRGFRVARVALILLSGAMLAFLLHYLRNHQWRFPGLSPSVAEERPSPGQSRAHPGARDANELMADDDTELPPVSSTMPSPPPGSSPPLAAPPR